jgi:DNA-binding GntR family transcriptional regulator
LQKRERTVKTHTSLARQVLDHARAKALRPGDRLPEEAFATACGVSRTPLRSAYIILETNGFLVKREAEGYFLAADLDADTSAMESQLDTVNVSLAKTILADRAARRLDDTQSVSFLIRRYNTTRAAVLNALTVLQQDGIIDRIPGQSWSFRPILDTPNAVADSHQFRLILEPAAILAPGFSLDLIKARQIRLTLQKSLAGRLGTVAFHKLDVDFHMLVAQGSGNRFARDSLLAHHRLRLITQKDFGTPEFRLRQAQDEHLAILDSLERRQVDVAADQMTLHLRLSRNQRPDAANRGSPPMPNSNATQ